MSRSKYLRPILSTGLLGALLLSGCTSDITEPSPPEAPAESASESTTTEVPETSSPEATSKSQTHREDPTEPLSPPEADRDSPEAAIDAAIYFIESYNYAALTGDAEAFRRSGTEKCGFCNSTIENIIQIYSIGGKQTGGRLFIDEPWTYAESISDGRVPVFMNATKESYMVFDIDNRETGAGPAKDLLLELILVHQDSQWLVSALNAEDR